MKKVVTSEELSRSAKRVAQSKRLKNKSRLPYQLLRRLIVEENKIPYVKISNKYYINYNHFLQYMDKLS